MRQFWLGLFVAVVVSGCQQASEEPAPAGGGGEEAGSSSKVMPATEEPATAESEAPPAAEPLMVPEKVAEAKNEPVTDVILPTDAPAEPTAAEAAEPADSEAEEPAADEAVAVASADGVGTLTGKFVYDGTAPAPAKIDIMNKDAEYCGKHLDVLVDESLTVGADGGIANIFVYVRSDIEATAEAEKAVEAKVRYDNKFCRYEPHALAVWAVKQTVILGNSDPINHAVKLDPFNSKNQAINASLPGGVDHEYTFGGGERVPVGVSCGIHPWQKGFILPLEHPYAAVTSADGSFSIPNMPTGKCEFQVWQEKAGYLAAKSEWKRGRFELEIKSGVNDLGTIKVSPSLFEK